MKTFAPRGLWGGDLRGLLEDLPATPAQVAKFLHVTERSVWRWLADDSAPFAVLAALWHETPAGRYATACDVGNELALVRGLAAAHGDALAQESARLARLLAICDTGAANDPMGDAPPPGGGPGGFARGPRYSAQVMGAQARALRIL
ncbi:MAG: hypothetical protein WA174_12815 [Rhodoferax sp.]